MNEYIAQLRALTDALNHASALYYTKGESPMSDAEWDQKYNELIKLERESGTVMPDSPTTRVGAEPLANFEQHR
ncbi:MAG: NAD-dependent DNA ligase LigA, partial [Clostridia bacterium]